MKGNVGTNLASINAPSRQGGLDGNKGMLT